MPPTYGNGKICYLELPAIDIGLSAAFYENVFGWKMRKRGDGAVAFDDGVGEVSGAFVGNRVASPTVGLLVYVMLDDIEATMKLVKMHGGKVVQEVGADAPEITARIQDPAGNIIGLYQEPSRQSKQP